MYFNIMVILCAIMMCGYALFLLKKHSSNLFIFFSNDKTYQYGQFVRRFVKLAKQALL